MKKMKLNRWVWKFEQTWGSSLVLDNYLFGLITLWKLLVWSCWWSYRSCFHITLFFLLILASKNIKRMNAGGKIKMEPNNVYRYSSAWFPRNNVITFNIYWHLGQPVFWFSKNMKGNFWDSYAILKVVRICDFILFAI